MKLLAIVNLEHLHVYISLVADVVKAYACDIYDRQAPLSYFISN